MFFSVIVPIYNVEQYLPACIDSVLAQTFDDFELILVDDGATDTCPQICDAYCSKDTRIKVIHKKNGGLVSARQAGIRIASGDYVFNLDSDDAIEPDVLAWAYEIISDTSADMVCFSYRWIKEHTAIRTTCEPMEEGLYDRARIEREVFPKLLMDDEMQHIAYYLAGKAVKRSLLTPHQLSVNLHLSLGEDLCCVVPCYLQAQRVYISKKTAYLYTVRTDSLSKKFNTQQIRQVENIVQEIAELIPDAPGDFEEQLCRYFSFMCFSILAAAAEGGFFDSLTELRDAIIHSPYMEKIENAHFGHITTKSRIGMFLMKKKRIRTAFCFLYLCGLCKRILGKG